MQEDSSSRAHLLVPCCNACDFCIPSSMQRVLSPASGTPYAGIRPATSYVSHVALEIGCGITKQMGCSVQRSLMRIAAIPSCSSDCGSQLFPPCSGYQQSWEICYLRLRRKAVQYKNTFGCSVPMPIYIHQVCSFFFSHDLHLVSWRKLKYFLKKSCFLKFKIRLSGGTF